jgi:hypothetical protein
MIIENPTLIFRNFQGKADNFNPEGFRNFCVVLDSKQETEALALGYDVKYLPGTDGNPGPMCLRVNLPSHMGFVEGNTAKVLDRGSLTPTKITLAGTHWKVGGRSGIKLYLVDIQFETKD